MDSDNQLIRKSYLIYAIILITTGVSLGAIGAHGLEKLVEDGVLEAKNVTSWKTGVLYQLLMAGGIILMILLEGFYRLNSLKVPLLILSIGVTLFSFSIYILVLNHMWDISILKKIMIPLTPTGGILMITAWVIFLLKIVTHKK
ncbi:MAG: DUF423 domain-containing protein [Flavobacteriales bacterium]|nr:DUF423 domain-containing protein [Flavobacteriales bacterium]